MIRGRIRNEKLILETENNCPISPEMPFWVETDAIKSIWLEQKNKSEDFTFDREQKFNIVSEK